MRSESVCPVLVFCKAVGQGSGEYGTIVCKRPAPASVVVTNKGVCIVVDQPAHRCESYMCYHIGSHKASPHTLPGIFATVGT